MEQNKYLEYLAELYPTIEKASTEIINLQSIINLPKGTEHFLSDIHGEYEAFSHVLRNGSGAVRKKIDDVFGHTLGTAEKRSVATLIYYPREKLEQLRQSGEDMQNWYRVTLYRLIELCRVVSSKYTRSKVRKALPPDYAYVIEELITEKPELSDKEAYYEAIIQTILDIGRAEPFIIAMAELIQRLVVDHLHIIGDIFDRGPLPHQIMDCLMDYHSLDIQWGNHDVLWMGAAAGQQACIATVIRLCLRYGNLDILEDGYGINMLPLVTFTLETYVDDEARQFGIKTQQEKADISLALQQRMHKAISVIQFKIEGQLSSENPEFGMNGRCLLDQIDYETNQIRIDRKQYELLDGRFPTIDPAEPYALSEQEKNVMERLTRAFKNCEKLQKHVKFLLKKGSLYKVYNGNLLYHGCVPMNEDGSFMEVPVYGQTYHGNALYDVLEQYVRKAFFSMEEEEKERGRNILWFLWSAPGSPLYGRSKMATFERYLIAEKETHQEVKNAYYQLLEKKETAEKILKEFGLEGEEARIINGHVPVHQKEGESPVKCEGKLLIIDGGFSRAYHRETGIAGYTLIYNSYGMSLAAHEPFETTEIAIQEEKDIVSHQIAVNYSHKRQTVGDTDNGKQLLKKIGELKELIGAYRSGTIKERGN
ncbi:fructose-1,6-bisphosphatase [Drancourtella massiliensis]|uniref:Fructose-1,6-bisphosphatase class 3 n=1 Tax=Drancourtella massiliensis TaxID=1632013 RepID=A0ABS2ED61_9FIRM|nr:fructose-1,6-bisphosphatase [Drancourtella massiliensis]MBM6742918.1 fructose-1,6-bisphosphatase [Drancourtella massiliensis]